MGITQGLYSRLTENYKDVVLFSILLLTGVAQKLSSNESEIGNAAKSKFLLRSINYSTLMSEIYTSIHHSVPHSSKETTFYLIY